MRLSPATARRLIIALVTVWSLTAVACSSSVESERAADDATAGDIVIASQDPDGNPYSLSVIDIDGRSLISDALGETVYGNTLDTPAAIACVSTCLDTWRPVRPQAGGVSLRLDNDRYAVRQRPDETLQVTYDGIPLYTWATADGPGSVRGVGVAGIWFALNADGTRLTRIDPTDS